MFQITYDQTKNRVIVKAQSISMEEVESYLKEFNAALDLVKPGFTGLTDLSGGKLFSQEVASALGHLGELCVQKGLTKWAYCTGSAISKMQMRRMFGDIVVSFEKLEEAEAYLD